MARSISRSTTRWRWRWRTIWTSFSSATTSPLQIRTCCARSPACSLWVFPREWFRALPEARVQRPLEQSAVPQEQPAPARAARKSALAGLEPAREVSWDRPLVEVPRSAAMTRFLPARFRVSAQLRRRRMFFSPAARPPWCKTPVPIISTTRSHSPPAPPPMLPSTTAASRRTCLTTC